MEAQLINLLHEEVGEGAQGGTHGGTEQQRVEGALTVVEGDEGGDEQKECVEQQDITEILDDDPCAYHLFYSLGCSLRHNRRDMRLFISSSSCLNSSRVAMQASSLPFSG